MAEGSVIKKVRRDGTVAWQARLDQGRDASGKRVRKIAEFATKREATRALTQWRAMRDSGRDAPKSNKTMEAYLGEWLISKKGIEESTYKDYAWWIDKHIVPHLGSLQLQALDTTTIEHWRDTLTASGLSGRSVALALGILKQALTRAVRLHLLTYNPAEYVEAPKSTAQPVQVWQLDEVRGFLSAVGADPLYALWLVAITTGLRRSELAGLRWEDVDLEASRIHVRQARKLAGSAPYIGAPKSDAGRRTLSLDSTSLLALNEHATRQAELGELMPGWLDTGYVFTTSIGTPFHPDVLSHRFRTLCDSLKASHQMPQVHLHSLRHTSVALALASGANIKVVSARLGHSRTAITLDVYAYLLSGQDEALAEGVAGLLFGQPQSACQPVVNLDTKNRPPKEPVYSGTPDRTRTYNLQIRNLMLYPLSHGRGTLPGECTPARRIRQARRHAAFVPLSVTEHSAIRHGLVR